jgi:cell division protein FtsB
MSKENQKFIMISVILLTITFSFAYYVANILFYGKNSYEVYSSLKNKKATLQSDIKRLQYENALLQKKYFELKNLEPEKL